MQEKFIDLLEEVILEAKHYDLGDMKAKLADIMKGKKSKADKEEAKEEAKKLLISWTQNPKMKKKDVWDFIKSYSAQHGITGVIRGRGAAKKEPEEKGVGGANKVEKVQAEFEAAKGDEKKISKLIFKYGESSDNAIIKIVKKYMKYEKKTASDFAGRDGDAEHSISK